MIGLHIFALICVESPINSTTLAEKNWKKNPFLDEFFLLQAFLLIKTVWNDEQANWDGKKNEITQLKQKVN